MGEGELRVGGRIGGTCEGKYELGGEREGM